MRLVDAALVAAVEDVSSGIAAPLPEATTRIASGFADTSFRACAVTLVSVRWKRSVATRPMPAAASWLVMSFSQVSP